MKGKEGGEERDSPNHSKKKQHGSLPLHPPHSSSTSKPRYSPPHASQKIFRPPSFLAAARLPPFFPQNPISRAKKERTDGRSLLPPFPCLAVPLLFLSSYLSSPPSFLAVLNRRNERHRREGKRRRDWRREKETRKKKREDGGRYLECTK